MSEEITLHEANDRKRSYQASAAGSSGCTDKLVEVERVSITGGGVFIGYECPSCGHKTGLISTPKKKRPLNEGAG